MPFRPATIRTQQERPVSRASAASRGYGRSWQCSSRAFLADRVWCCRCLDRGLYVPAEVTDHIVPHKGDPVLFWDVSNWQPLCKPCHDHKTATEDGGFGRAQSDPNQGDRG